MTEEVKICVNSRTDFFVKYVVVPAEVQTDLDRFLSQITALGESSTDAAAFEQQYQASGLSDAFNSLVSRCTPQAYQMTQADKDYSRQVAKEIFTEDKDRILREAGQDVLESVEMKIESNLRTQRIRQMSEAGVLDDYTRATNMVEDVGILARLFRKKKK